MSKRLTARELYQIYTPAFDAAGERPMRGRYVLALNPLHWGWSHLDSQACYGSGDIEDAAMICRCWAEDWLMTHDVGCVESGSAGPLYVWHLPSKGYCTRLNSSFAPWKWHPSLHHALSAAVVAAAKAKQIKAQGACPLCGLPPPGPDEYVVYDPNEKVCRLCFQSTTRRKTSDKPKETTP